MSHASAKSSALIKALLAVQLIGFLVPVALVSIPPLMDYPNHLVRYWLISGGAEGAPLSGMYGVDFNLLTNIGLDLVARYVGPWAPTNALGSAFIAAAVVLPCAGMAALNYVLFRRLDWWLLVPGLLVWNQALLAGFLNFNVGLGLALLLAAADFALAPRSPRAAFLLRFGGGLVLGLIHIFALAFYIALLTGLALGETFDWRTRPRATATRLAIALAPALLAFVVIVALSPQLPGSYVGAENLKLLDDFKRGLGSALSREKMKGAIVAFIAYSPILDLIVVAAICGMLLILAARRRLRAHAGLLMVALGLAGLFALAPMDLAGTGWFDRRFALMFPMVFVAALHPYMLPRWGRVLAVAMVVVTTARTAQVTFLWKAFDHDVAAVHEALAAVTPGSRVMPVLHESPRGAHPSGRYLGTGDPGFWHLPVLAIMWRQAFVPTLFTARGKQPVYVRPPYDKIAVPEGPVPSVHVLVDPTRDHPEATPYVEGWRDKFDFVLVVNADLPDDHGPFQPPPDLEKVADRGFAQVYRIRR